jgi:hypothetical protein
VKEANSEVWQDQDHFISLRISSYQGTIPLITHLVVATLRWFETVSTNTLMPCSVSQNYSANFQAVVILSLGHGLRFCNFFKHAVSKILHLELLIKAVQQINVFRIALTNLRT